jgi:hypothetical protein
MQSTHARKRLGGLLLAILATLSFAAPAFAASTGGSSSETLAVVSAISISGIPASIDYGTASGGSNADAATIPLSVTTDNPNGWRLDLTATALTGAGTIPATARSFRVMNAAGGAIPIGTFNGTYGPYVAGGVNPVAADSTGTATFSLDARIAVPNGTPAGSYTGTLTFLVSTK